MGNEALRHRLIVLFAGALCATLVTAHGRPAQACGGFFCGQVPVDQSGEHLLFAVEEDETGQRTIVAHIQVQYQGPAEDFAWVLPLPSAPLEMGTGSNAVFSTLRGLTDPRFSVEWLPDRGDCEDEEEDLFLAGAGDDGEYAADGDADRDEPPEDDPVRVLQQLEVGPYETAVVESDDAQALVDWLAENDYTVPESSLPPIESYVNAGHVFLALKLASDRAAGDITPIVVRIVEDGPCIPLLLTAIAATPDMPIYAWVLAEKGIVSIDDFYEIQLNDAAIAWFASGRNYRAVSTAAVNEAGGRGFIREYAGPSNIAAGALYDESMFDLDVLRAASDPLTAVYWVLGRFPLDATLAELLGQFAPMPAEVADQGITPLEYYSCVECYGVPTELDAEGLATAFDAVLITPLRDAQGLFDRHPYLTRLFTTISPDEMTQDPLFRENDFVPDVARDRVATSQRRCDMFHRDRDTAPIRLVLPSGTSTTVYAGDPLHPSSAGLIDEDGNGIDDRTESASESMPSLARAIQYGESGPGDTIIDNRDRIDDLLHGDGGGCGVVPGLPGAGTALGLLIGLGALVTAARRRRS
jgi:hypothetical protein